MSDDRWFTIVSAIERAVDEHAYDDEDGNGWMPLEPLQAALWPGRQDGPA